MGITQKIIIIIKKKINFLSLNYVHINISRKEGKRKGGQKGKEKAEGSARSPVCSVPMREPYCELARSSTRKS